MRVLIYQLTGRLLRFFCRNYTWRLLTRVGIVTTLLTQNTFLESTQDDLSLPSQSYSIM